jgi:superfamily II DNA/RNA helicase
MKFSDLNLDERLLEAISYMGFDTPTPVQEQVIPLILENRDLIACAQTGTGKTGAYVLPILHKLAHKKDSFIDTLVIVPTRELAMQIEQQIQGFSYFISAGAVAIYGGGDGRDWDLQKAALKNQADIIIATPGKLLSHLKMGDVKFDKIKHLILDEADKMLDMGFIDDIGLIISYLPQQRQTLMFSATMPNSIRQLAKKILVNPEEISLSMSKPAEGVDQKVYLVEEEYKVKLINHVLAERKDYESILVFTSTKSKVSEIVSSLNRNGLPAHGISSNLEQDEREEVLRKFHARLIRILVATDVMSRGIDVKEINMVINYDLPHDAEDYVHRVGRTARVNAKGEAVTLVTHREMYRLKKIEQLIEATIPKLQPPFAMGHVRKQEEARHKTNNRRKFHGGKRDFNRKNNRERS